MTTLFRSAALALVLAASGVAAASAQTQMAAPPSPPAAAQPAADTAYRATTLSLSAYGETRIAPDMATITLGVTSDGPTAAAALQANSAKMTQVVAALRRAGIPERDIQTSGLSLSPQYVYVENRPPRLNGYQAANQVTITVRDLTRLGPTLDATVAAGANTVAGIGFGLQDPAAAENAARQAAVRALQAKAKLYAAATGYRINRLVNLSEGGGYTPEAPQPMMDRRVMLAAAPQQTPVSPGELNVRIDISGLYELTR